jgi:menaquinone-dependent protoporphyrinogen oxidase
MKMKTAIIYASTHGTTEKTSNLIHELLGMKGIDMFDLKKTNHIDLTNYERVIIGSSIHAGNNQMRVKKFCKNNTVELLQKKLGLFICCMNEPEYEKQFAAAYPEILRKHSVATCFAGGEFIFEKMNFFQKAIVKKVSGVKETISKINTEAIEDFVISLQK